MAGFSSRATIHIQRNALSAITIRQYSSKTLSRQSSLASSHASSDAFPSLAVPAEGHQPQAVSPLSILPLSSVIRSFAITSISSSKILLGPSLKIMSILAHSQSPILSPDRNPLLRFFLKHTFYRQFCAGEDASEVRRTIDSLKSLGFRGVLLGYAREVVLDENQVTDLASCGESEAAEVCIRKEIIPWANGTLETVRLVEPDDFVSVKFTGAGSQALYDLAQQRDPSPALKEAIDSICDLAAERGVKLLFDAEQQAVQAGIDAWTLKYMKKYNNRTAGRAVVYGTYQAYLKATPSVLASHLSSAQKEGFTLGVKLVRGAYLGSDPRHLIHDTKADTDAAYNAIAESLAQREYGAVLKPTTPGSEFPDVNVVLAGHNLLSVRKVQALRTTQAKSREPQTELVYAQLQGMADEVSCELVQAGQIFKDEQHTAASTKANVNVDVDIPRTYKYLVWGTTGECMKYLLRRAQENKDAVQRTRDGRDAMAGELWRRCKGIFGSA